MRFSIIIPAHNAANYIRKCLDSVKQQTFTDYELIIICDSCEDNTAEIAKLYTDKVFNVNFCADGFTRNKGLDEAKGEWVLFLDDDDWWLHEYVLWQIDKKLRELPEIDILCFSFIFKGRMYATPMSNGNGDRRFQAVWNKCWRREFIGNTRFPGMPRISDSFFDADMFKKNPRVYDWDMPMYYYNFLRKGSQTERSRR